MNLRRGQRCDQKDLVLGAFFCAALALTCLLTENQSGLFFKLNMLTRSVRSVARAVAAPRVRIINWNENADFSLSHSLKDPLRLASVSLPFASVSKISLIFSLFICQVAARKLHSSRLQAASAKVELVEDKWPKELLQAAAEMEAARKAATANPILVPEV